MAVLPRSSRLSPLVRMLSKLSSTMRSSSATDLGKDTRAVFISLANSVAAARGVEFFSNTAKADMRRSMAAFWYRSSAAFRGFDTYPDGALRALYSYGAFLLPLLIMSLVLESSYRLSSNSTIIDIRRARARANKLQDTQCYARNR